MSDKPTIERLHELFRLDAETGKLFWRVRPARCIQVGDEAGTLHSSGYRHIMIADKKYKAHRIVFAIANGRWPEPEADHRNRIKDDNRPCNLREATGGQNQHNTGKRKDNTSGVKGVSWNKRDQKWRVGIKVDGRNLYLGGYDDLETAGYAYLSASLKYHGEFSRTSP